MKYDSALSRIRSITCHLSDDAQVVNEELNFDSR